MSTFKVVLNQGTQGSLDQSLVGGASIQRTMYAPGPDGVERKMIDGATFSDTNYWKRYCSGVASSDVAFLQILTDDGSVWDDFNHNANAYPVVISKTITAGTTYTSTGNSVDILGTYGSYATGFQISTDHTINVKMNGSANAILSVTSSAVQTFNSGDFSVTSLAFDNSASGASNAAIQVVLFLKTVSST